MIQELTENRNRAYQARLMNSSTITRLEDYFEFLSDDDIRAKTLETPKEYHSFGIARVTQVSWSWLQNYVKPQLAHTPRPVKVSGKMPAKLTSECDELWSFVNSKKNEIYIWLALERTSRANYWLLCGR